MVPLLYFRLMIDFLYKLDYQILIFINQILSNPIFDFIMPLFHDIKNWIPFLLLFWIYLCYTDKKNRVRLIILIPFVILIGDQLGRYIKHMELRDRPWFALGDAVNHLIGYGGKHFSFPSNHALNTASMMTIFSNLYTDYSRYFWGYLFVIMFSRVYIGVHYPFDVVVGAAMGILVGLCCLKLVNRFI